MIYLIKHKERALLQIPFYMSQTAISITFHFHQLYEAQV